MIAVSVIIPVYNVEPYIERCIDSLVNQTFKDFELIIVDDCGTDDSVELVKKRLSKTSIKYKLITNEKNLGVSASRNAGVANSNSKYILFIDSDDWIEDSMLEKLYSAAVSNRADIVDCKIIEFSETENRFLDKTVLLPGIYTTDEYLNLYFQNNTNLEVCSKLLCRKILKGTKFPLKVNFEDILTLPYIIKNARTIVQLDTPLYYYVKRKTNTSITGSRPKNIVGFLLSLNKMKEDFKNSEEAIDFIYRNLLIVAYILILYSANYREAQKDIKQISKFINLKDLFRSKSVMKLKHLIYLAFMKTSTFFFYYTYTTFILRRPLTNSFKIEKIDTAL